MRDLHIGHAKAFKGWKLIWSDASGNVQIASISARTAKMLLASGMSLEG